MAIEVITKTSDGVEIGHTERELGVIFTIIALSMYILAGMFFWNLYLKGKFSFAQLQTDDQIILIFIEMAFIFGAAITFFYSFYVTSPLAISYNGILVRRFILFSSITTIGAPFTFEIVKYQHRPYGRIEAETFFDLYLVGPNGSHIVTPRGEPETFLALARSAEIPIRYAPTNL